MQKITSAQIEEATKEFLAKGGKVKEITMPVVKRNKTVFSASNLLFDPSGRVSRQRS